ncbi:UBP-type zinc finger domain-containing protein [Streptomyces sp. NPDC048604]|uniref:UBP-type zinc finger domain-containing protein n=1 Tax=Streptomyces sp. NPDC048604 TaxID=3365578 RepID=UPI003719B1C0
MTTGPVGGERGRTATGPGPATNIDGSWTVAPDGGRPDSRVCAHLTDVARPAEPPGDGCEQCLALGWAWSRLRWCTTCGHVGCCDSSQGRHAHAHYAATGHPVALSLDPEEKWGWCYADDLFLVELVEAPSPEGDST